MESLKFLLEEIGQRILEYAAKEGFEALAEALGIKKEKLALFVVIPTLPFLLASGILELPAVAQPGRAGRAGARGSCCRLCATKHMPGSRSPETGRAGSILR